MCLFFFGTILLIVCFIRKKESVEKTEYLELGGRDKWYVDFVHPTSKDNSKRANRLRLLLVMDHWFLYAAICGIPGAAWYMEHVNEFHGIPWEYHVAFFLCLVLRCLHERHWYGQVGPHATRRMSKFVVARQVLAGICLTLDAYLDAVFIVIAIEVGSLSAHASIFIFVVFNLVGQLLFFTVETLGNSMYFHKYDQVLLLFRARGWEVM